MKPPLACVNCRARKKKCDRIYPICSYCLKTHDRCVYRVGRHSGNQAASRQVTLESTIGGDADERASWTAAAFLDFDLFHDMLPQVKLPSITLTPALVEFVQSGYDGRQIQLSVKRFINYIDAWIPFLPRKELYWMSSNISSIDSMSLTSPEDILLLACISILADPLVASDPRTKEYITIKSTLLSAEVSGAISLRLLQVLVLLLLYEFGHGVYPAASNTLSKCVCHLAALGIDDTSPTWSGVDNWIEVETRRRLWWVVYVIERQIALGCPQRSLLMQEAIGSKILPSDELSWDRGEFSSQFLLTISSPATTNMGGFRLLVLAAHLLGQVFQHARERNKLEPQFEAERTLQLYRTIHALTNVLEYENLSQPITRVSAARSVLQNAYFILYSNSFAFDEAAGPSQNNSESDLESPCGTSARILLTRARNFLSGNAETVDSATPFLLHWVMMGFKYYYQMYSIDGRAEHKLALEDLEKSLFAMDKRWRLAGVYMSLLNVYQSTYRAHIQGS